MTMCDPYDLEHPECETTKMARHLEHDQGTLKWTPAEDGGHSIFEKRTRPLELIPGESDYNEEDLHDWDNPFWTEQEKHFNLMTPESARKFKEWKKKMAEQKNSNEYYTGDVDPYINGIPKGLKQKPGYDIGEMAMRISKAEEERNKRTREFLRDYTEEVIKPALNAEKKKAMSIRDFLIDKEDVRDYEKELEERAKEYGFDQVRLRKETDPRMPAWERRKYVEDDKNKDKAVLKEHLTKIIEKTLDHAMERQCMYCQIPSALATDYPVDLLTVIPTHKDRDAVLNELFEEYRELGYRVDLLGSTCITSKKARYGWMDGVAFNWGDDEDYEKAMSNVMEIDLPDDDDSPVMSEETIQWIDFEQMKPPKHISLYLIKYLNVDGLEHINIYWWNSDNDDNEWRFNLSPLAGVKILAWSNIPLRRKGE